jgi:hypothetical protein
MNTLVRHATIFSTVALMTAATAGLASAQEGYGGQNGKPGQDGTDGRSGYCVENPDRCGDGMNRSSDEDQGYRKKRRVEGDEDRADWNDGDQPRRMKQAQGEWKYDSNRHKRRRHKDDEFRFYFGGFWYPQPYWQGYGLVGGRIGCAEGRSIVRERGFYRVRTVECAGRAYTYIGRRHGDTFQVIVSARSGRIIDVNPI